MLNVSIFSDGPVRPNMLTLITREHLGAVAGIFGSGGLWARRRGEDAHLSVYRVSIFSLSTFACREPGGLRAGQPAPPGRVLHAGLTPGLDLQLALRSAQGGDRDPVAPRP